VPGSATTGDETQAIGLAFAFEARITIAEPIAFTDAQGGLRRVIPITGGSFEGPRLRGSVVPGGADWQVIWPDGLTELEARYTIRVEDGTLVSVVNRGLRHGPKEVMDRLKAGKPVAPGSYYFRAAPSFKAPPGPYDWLNRSLFLCTGDRHPDAVVLRVFEVL